MEEERREIKEKCGRARVQIARGDPRRKGVESRAREVREGEPGNGRA